jgi:hypothetical protein
MCAEKMEVKKKILHYYKNGFQVLVVAFLGAGGIPALSCRF